MIRTLKINAAQGPLKLANVQIQPVVKGVDFTLNVQTAQANNSANPYPPFDKAISLAAYTQNNESHPQRIISPTASNIIERMARDPRFRLPATNPSFNVILPSFATATESSRRGDAHSTDDFVVSPKKFEPYEQLTGISQERPEIVMMLDFLPMFLKDVSQSQPLFANSVERSGIYPFMTDAGKFIDTQLQIRSLQNSNMINMVQSLRKYPKLEQMFSERHQTFISGMTLLADTSSYLMQLVKGLSRLKSQFDLRDELHIVNTQQALSRYLASHTEVRDDISNNALTDSASQNIPTTYTVEDSLSTLGYASANVKEVFASTKVWLQLILELKQILKYHSLAFLDIDPSTQRNDDSAGNLTKPTAKLFSLNSDLPDLPSVASLVNIGQIQVGATVAIVNKGFLTLYDDVHFKSEETRIAALLNFITKEYRYSFGLSQPRVTTPLQNFYGHKLSTDNNSDLFDSIIGNFGNNISDLPSTQDNSLACISQQQINDVGVLTFESKYISGDTGDLSPGATFYVDQVLKTDGTRFDTSRLESLSLKFSDASQQFGAMVNNLNMLGQQSLNRNIFKSTNFRSLLSSPIDLFSYVLNQLVDVTTGITLSSANSDILGAVFALASTNSQLKSMLFMYTMAKMTRSNRSIIIGRGLKFLDNTAQLDTLIDLIVNEIGTLIPLSNTSTSVQTILSRLLHSTTLTVNKETVRSTLKNGSPLFTFVEDLMTQILSTMNINSEAIIDEHTRYGGFLDSVMMMVTFDMLTSIIARYTNQSFTATHYGPLLTRFQTISFVITRSKVNNLASIQDVNGRINRELSLIQRLVLSVTNTLNKMVGTITGYVNYLNSPSAIAQLKQISAVVTDPQMLQLLLSEQQVFLLASSVADLEASLSSDTSATTLLQGDTNGDDDFDSDDEVKELDYATVTPLLRNALYGLFNTSDFASKNGYNKKILTVGIPNNFVQRLQQEVSITNLKKTSFINKQRDIVNVVVYKVDMIHSDIIYKPKQFMFELSRFPVRDQSQILSIPNRPLLSDIINAVPTRDFGGLKVGTDPMYGNLGGAVVARDTKTAFGDEAYSFLTQQQREDILKNHITSYLVEFYIKLLTGISVADYHFDMVEVPTLVDTQFVGLLMAHRLLSYGQQKAPSSRIGINTTPTGGVLFSQTARSIVVGKLAKNNTTASGIAGGITLPTQAAQARSIDLSTLSIDKNISPSTSLVGNLIKKEISPVLKDAQTIQGLGASITSQSDPLEVSKRMLMPKQFDRVFNLVVDPDEFEIDYEKTIQNPNGKQVLMQLITTGDVISEDENYQAEQTVRRMITSELSADPAIRLFVRSRAPENFANFRYRDRDKSEGDLMFEKYFVTVETFDETAV